ncbi:hypothetical protein ACFW1A_01155 [Kitasatospora sp. NPDC058965]|uniref:hypothetical protein n=1 Tax=Kitasatospora sp. NPDC058965 TaxID=3346682 RepID=UPI003687F0FB
MRRALTAFAAFALATAGVVVAAPTASAGGYGCTGNLVGSFSDKHNGTVWGTLYVYYDSSTGDNCAVNVANSAGYYGTSTIKNVVISECSQTSPGPVCDEIGTPQEDNKNYYDYAGPVRVHAPGHCIYAAGDLFDPGVTTYAEVQTSPQAAFCG